jgi:general stress protein 26
MTESADAAALKKISDMIAHIKVAMLTSEDGGHLRSRPMVAAQQDFRGELFFFTHASAHKVAEIGAESRVGIAYADGHHQLYLSLSGTARIGHDTALIKAHWSEAMRTWFPKGVEDPDLAILTVKVDQAEYWDAPSSTMVYLYGYVKAVTTGHPPQPGENEKLRVA